MKANTFILVLSVSIVLCLLGSIALAEETHDVSSVIEKGKELKQSGDINGAIEQFSEALKMSPQDTYIYEEMSELLALKGDYEEAIQVIQKARSLYDDEASYYTRLGIVSRRAGKRDAALTYFKRALSLNDNWDPSLVYHTTQVYEEKGDFTAALDILEQFLAMFPNNPDHNRYAASLYCFKLEKYDQALPFALKALEGDPHNVDTLYLLGMIYRGLNQPKLAHEHFVQGEALETHHELVYTANARMYEEEGDYNNAILHWEKYLAQRPTDVKVYRHVGDLHLQLKQYESALQNYRTFLQHEPEDISTLVSVGLMYDRLGKFKKSYAVYKRALPLVLKELEENPDDADLLYLAGTICQGIDQPDVAQQYFRKAKNRYVYSEQAQELEESGDYLTAIDRWKKHLQINPADINVYRHIGDLYWQLKEYTFALDYYSKVLERDPHNIPALVKTGTVYSKLGRPAESRSAYERALPIALEELKVKPNDTNLLFYLGVMCQGTNQPALAQQYFEQAKNRYIYQQIAYMYEDEGDYVTAIENWIKHLEINQDDFKVYRHIGDLYWEHEQYELALEHYETFLTYDSDNVRIYTKVGTIYEKLGKKKKGLETFKQALPLALEELDENSSNADLLFLVGTMYEKLGQPKVAEEYFQRAKNRYVYSEIARQYERDGYFELALENWKKHLEINSTDINVYRHIGDLYWQRENYTLALDYYTKVLDYDSNNIPTIVKIGNIYGKLGQEEQSLEMYQKAYALNPDNKEVLVALAYFYEVQGDSVRSKKYFERLFDLSGSFPEDTKGGELYDLLLKQAQQFKQEGKYDDAFERFKVIVRFNPHDPYLYKELSELQMLKGNYDEAITYAQEAVDLKPREAYYYNHLGALYRKKGDGSKALETFEKALTLNHNWDVSLFFNIAQVYEEEKEYASAIAVLKKFLLEFPDSANINRYVASVYCFKLHEHKRALPFALRSFDKEPDNADTLYLLGMIYRGLDEPAEALSYLEKVEDARPRDKFIYSHIAALYEELDNDTSAIQYWNKHLKHNPGDIDVHNHVGDLYWEHKEYRSALDYYLRVLEREPYNASFLLKVGSLYYELGEKEKSLLLYKRALAIEPNNEKLLLTLARFYESQGEYTESKKYLSKLYRFESGKKEQHNTWMYLVYIGIFIAACCVEIFIRRKLHYRLSFSPNKKIIVLTGVVLLSVLIITRFLCLYDDGYFVKNEEGIYRGTIAREVIDGAERNVLDFLWWDREYGIVAYGLAMVPIVLTLGDALFSIAIVPFVIIVAMFILMYLLLLTYFGKRVAFFAALLFIFAPKYFCEYQLIPYSGYNTPALYAICSLSILFYVFYNEKYRTCYFAKQQYWTANKRLLVIFAVWGIVSGFANYCFFTSLPYLLSFIIVWFIFDRLFFVKRYFLIYLLFFLIGFSPWILVNLHIGFAGIFVPIHQARGDAVEYLPLFEIIQPSKIIPFFKSFFEITWFYLRRLLAVEKIYGQRILNFPPQLLFSIAFLSITFFIIKLGWILIRLVQKVFSRKGQEHLPLYAQKELILFFPFFVYLIVCALYPGELQLRWFFPTYLFICMIVALMCESVISLRFFNKVRLSITALVTVVLFLAGLLQYEILFDTKKTYAYNQVFDLKGLTVKFTGKLYRHDVNFLNRDLFYAEQMLAQNTGVSSFYHKIKFKQERNNEIFLNKFISALKEELPGKKPTLFYYLGVCLGENIGQELDNTIPALINESVPPEYLHFVYEGFAVSLANRRFNDFYTSFTSRRIEKYIAENYRHYFYICLGKRIRERFKNNLDDAVRMLNVFSGKEKFYVTQGFIWSAENKYLRKLLRITEDHDMFRAAVNSLIEHDRARRATSYIKDTIKLNPHSSYDYFLSLDSLMLFHQYMISGGFFAGTPYEFLALVIDEMPNNYVPITKRLYQLYGYSYGLDTRGLWDFPEETFDIKLPLVEYRAFFFKGYGEAIATRYGDDIEVMERIILTFIPKEYQYDVLGGIKQYRTAKENFVTNEKIY